ncbi:hypothetical protein B9G53_04970 [Pseudanabaena sp. SR411]|uniref:hypothetical protein n=1 Tax=Pseudanabaena sp. SR411 TaxID=1980935 RepID=UPI000B985DF3|nr:hypothetical protein [Pseudanabaena sp. SR411]OYQ66178.1 hypothetical protein B9G53_04970 [Pseudanabaena sp. SR411]
MTIFSFMSSPNRNPQFLTSLSEEQQFDRVCVLLEEDIVEALRIANSTLKSKKYFQDLLERGLEVADASEIEVWLRYLVPRLGMRYVINVLEGKLIEKPQQVKKAMYWLPKFLNMANEKELISFRNLENKILIVEY